MFLYYYKAVSGVLMPATTKKDLLDLRDSFKGSATPLCKVFAVSNHGEAIRLIALMEAWLTHTPEYETGLRFALTEAIKDLLTV